MPTNILMPALSPTMETGTLAKWYVKEGDEISPGEILADIETDKATMEFEAIDSGRITKIYVPEGTEDISVNSPIAEIILEDEDLLTTKKPSEIDQTNASKQNVKVSDNEPKFTFESSTSVESHNQTRIKISPLAKKIAANHNIDIKNIAGTGPSGRIVKIDVLSLLEAQPDSNNRAQKNKKTEDSAKSQGKNLEAILNMFSTRQYELIPTTNLRKIVAARLTEAKRSIPHFYLRRTIEMEKLIKLREELNESLSKNGMKISVNDFIIKAAAKSLQDNPKCNVVWGEENIIQLQSSDISVAVAIDDGLITPVILDAEKKGLQDISIEIKEKIKKAREKKLHPTEYIGGSFSISNLGMMGIENFDAVINPPQASILAVGSCVKKALVNDRNEIFVGEIMSVTLSADHRVIDGAVGALFIDSIVDYLSNPLKLLV